SGVVMLSDGTTILSVGGVLGPGAGEVKFWDTAAGKETGTITKRDGRVKLVAATPDRRLVAWKEEKGVVVYDVAARAERPPLVGMVGEPSGLAFSTDGRRLAGSCGFRVTVWSVIAGKKAKGPLELDIERPTCVAFAPDGVLAVGSRDKSIRIWNLLNR